MLADEDIRINSRKVIQGVQDKFYIYLFCLILILYQYFVIFR